MSPDRIMDSVFPPSKKGVVYAGCGSQQLPDSIGEFIADLSTYLSESESILRSPGTPGASAYFERGATLKEVFLPYKNFNGQRSDFFRIGQPAFDLAKSVTPKWTHCNESIRRSAARYSQVVLGENLNLPIEILFCWTEDRAFSTQNMSGETGEIRTAIILAEQRGIPVLNLNYPPHFEAVRRFLASRRHGKIVGVGFKKFS